mmetsp:Transcript_56966/g.123832  ORF Transcript_56966/g.123832 Transcript_56966/m.123832 type:complete len:99 (+) Transcript_56966:1223-1519(+)
MSRQSHVAMQEGWFPSTNTRTHSIHQLLVTSNVAQPQRSHRRSLDRVMSKVGRGRAATLKALSNGNVATEERVNMQLFSREKLASGKTTMKLPDTEVV